MKTIDSDKEIIEIKLKTFGQKKNLDVEHKKLVDEITKYCQNLGYMIKPMGSATKNTMIPHSDFDLLAILPNNKKHYSANTALVNLSQLLHSPFNPKLGNHSVIIRRNNYGVDIVPARKTNEPDQFLIPVRKGNNIWIKRGQDAFTKEFNKLNAKLGDKLSTSVKFLKMWNYRKSNLDLSGLIIEKVCYDALKTCTLLNKFTEAVILCFTEMKQQVSQGIRHPAEGPQLNKLSDDEKELWIKVIDRDLEKLKKWQLVEWEKYF